MTITSALYSLLRGSRDARAVSKTLSSGSPRPVALRVVRRSAGKATGRLFRKIR